MNRTLLATATILIAYGLGNASAADLLVKAPPLVAPPSWTGFYVGANAGASVIDPRLNTALTSCNGPPPCVFNSAFGAADLAAINAAGSPTLSSTNFTGGGQVGYNYQIGNAVFGLEADIESFSSNESRTVRGPFTATPGAFGNNFTVGTSVKTDWLSTVRGRVGWTFWPNILLYATGGLAVAEVEVRNSYSDDFAVQPASGSSSRKETQAGWTVGAGGEYALNRNWSVKGEYLYLDLGHPSTTTVLFVPLFAPTPVVTSAHVTAHIARVGVNYKF
jgi:outer membrane immunogenic protein